MKTTTLISTLLFLGASLNAQSLLLGWDFTSTTNYNGVASITAEKTDLAPDVNASSYGAVYFDGSFGSTDTFGASGANVVYSNNTSGLSNNSLITTRNANDGFSGNNALLLDGFSAAYPGSVVFAVNAGSTFDSWSFSYAAGVGGSSSDGVTLNWSYSFTGGSDYVSLSGDSVSGSDEGNSYSGFADSTAASDIYLKLDITGLNSANAFGDEYVLIDNFAVYAVPEPSTYAAIAGAFALAFAAYRRRK